MSTNHTFSRRATLRTAIVGGLGLAASRLGFGGNTDIAERGPLTGHLKQAITRYSLQGMTLDEMCLTVKQLGLSALDHVGPPEWPILKAHGIDSSLCSSGTGVDRGFSERGYHDELVAHYTDYIDHMADMGYRNVECFSGKRNGMDIEQGLKNTEDGLKRIVGHAEKRGVMLALKMMNSKVDHLDYLLDHTELAVEIYRRIGSPNLGLIYDTYHMQIMEGNIIATIRKYHQYFIHYHTAGVNTGGVPGRHEIGADQELNYPAIFRAIRDTGFKGYVAHEFSATGPDQVASFREAIQLCDI